MRRWLRFVRFPNTLTTVADVLAGAALGASVTGAGVAVPELVLTALAGMCLYGYGIVLNDVADRDKDAKLHPERALPSGDIPLGAARVLLLALLAAALGLAGATGRPATLVCAAAIAVGVFLYDVVFKDVKWIASPVMGLCRGLDLAMGASLAGAYADGAPAGWLVVAVPLAYAALIMMVTVISTFEEREPSPVARSVALIFLVLLYGATALPGRQVAVTLVLAACLAVHVVRPAFGTPRWGLVIRNAIFTLVFFDALIALGSGAWWHAGICAALYPVIRWSAKVIGQKGS